MSKTEKPAASKRLDWEAIERAARASMPLAGPKVANPAGSGPLFACLMTERQAAEEIGRHRWPHYVYALCSDTGAAFYIGKGSGLRLLNHAAESRKGVESAKCQMVRAAGDRLRYAIFAVCQDEAYALALEAWLINAHYADLMNLQVGTVRACMEAFMPIDPLARSAVELEQTLAMLDRAERECDRYEKLLA